jgi:hypothetical protein
MDISMTERTVRALWPIVATLFGIIAAGPVAASSVSCTEGRGFVDWMVARAPRAYFYSAPGVDDSAPAKLGRYVITGDFVFMRRPDLLQGPPTGMEADFACVKYIRAGRAASYGWLRKSDLMTLNVMNDVEGPEPPAALKSLLAAMPPAGPWPRAGKTPDPVYWEHDFIGDFLCIPRFEPEKKQMCVVTSARSLDGPECGTLGSGNRYATFDEEGWYIAYLFNNGIAVVSQTGQWGNHGQSDPSGFYVPEEAATRACPGHIAP